MKREEFLTRSGLEVRTLEIWLEQRWLLPDAEDVEAGFSDIDVARAHFIRDLQGGLGVNDPGIDVILHLVDQLHGLRRAFSELKEGQSGPGNE
ncbi:chaperone modulator CbpM [Methylobacterium brachythecii]|nr:chaperone modulator CbpM [Methylobacterium brachythecii]MBB3901705.1 chaperone modulatory protein CbpM [Methylobacterium brachythecii]